MERSRFWGLGSREKNWVQSEEERLGEACPVSQSSAVHQSRAVVGLDCLDCLAKILTVRSTVGLAKAKLNGVEWQIRADRDLSQCASVRISGGAPNQLGRYLTCQQHTSGHGSLVWLALVAVQATVSQAWQVWQATVSLLLLP